ncbi:MAG: regulatory protein RecX [Ignavibacteriaceae bacterium]|nr:regulatory protein RecX [Ignavibacteriaceae bacterium]
MKLVKAKKVGKNKVELEFDIQNKIVLSYETFLKFQLKLKQEISQEYFNQLIEEDNKFVIKQIALGYLARRLHSKHEIRVKLKQKRFDSESIEKIIHELEEKKYLNDENFAYTFVDEKVRGMNWGRNKIRAELTRRGIPADIIDAITRERFSEDSEITAGMELAKKKLDRLMKRKADPNKIKTSVLSFLTSRGYSYETCKLIYGLLFKTEDLKDI